jgi:hypothetical protein
MNFTTIFGIFLASLFVLSLITYKMIQFLSGTSSAAPRVGRKAYSAHARSHKDDVLMESGEIQYSKVVEPAKPGEDLLDLIQSYEEKSEGTKERIVEKPIRKTVVKEKRPPEIEAMGPKAGNAERDADAHHLPDFSPDQSREDARLDPSRRLDGAGHVEEFLGDLFATEETENESYDKDKSFKSTIESSTGTEEKKLLEASPVEEFLEDIFKDEETKEAKETGDSSHGDLEELLAPEVSPDQNREDARLDSSRPLDESVERLTNTNSDLSPGRYPECFGTDAEFKKCKKDCGVVEDCSKAVQLLACM